jgi:hypothetical protein
MQVFAGFSPVEGKALEGGDLYFTPNSDSALPPELHLKTSEDFSVVLEKGQAPELRLHMPTHITTALVVKSAIIIPNMDSMQYRKIRVGDLVVDNNEWTLCVDRMKLLKENPGLITVVDGQIHEPNNSVGVCFGVWKIIRRIESYVDEVLFGFSGN